MNIPPDAIISDDKITHYLLVLKARNDKSKFLEKAGFTQANPTALRDAIQSLVACAEAVKDKANEYGLFYRVEGDLIGPNGVRLAVATVWLQRSTDGRFQFVTLVPQGVSR